MNGSSSASYTIGMAENCLHMKSPACPQTGDFDLIYRVWWWMTVGSSEYTSPDFPGLKQPYKESSQINRVPFEMNQDKLLKGETTGPTSCSDQLLFLYVSAQKILHLWEGGIHLKWEPEDEIQSTMQQQGTCLCVNRRRWEEMPRSPIDHSLQWCCLRDSKTNPIRYSLNLLMIEAPEPPCVASSGTPHPFLTRVLCLSI